MKVDFTEQESNKLLQLIHIAIKAEGLNAAEQGLYFYSKLRKAFEEGQKQNEVSKENED